MRSRWLNIIFTVSLILGALPLSVQASPVPESPVVSADTAVSTPSESLAELASAAVSEEVQSVKLPDAPVITNPEVGKVVAPAKTTGLPLAPAIVPYVGEVQETKGIAAPLKAPYFMAPSTTDPVVQQSVAGEPMPAPIVNIEGIDNIAGVYPPDPDGQVGPNHYVQMVNVSTAIYDKQGNLLYGPFHPSDLWPAGDPCRTSNDGDPVVLYDQMADRWLLTQFALPSYPNPPYYECIAVSKGPNPTNNPDDWYPYTFDAGGKMNDYPKLAVWPDAYYMTTNQFYGDGTGGAGIWAFDRDKMLNGEPAGWVFFDLGHAPTPYNLYRGVLPSNLMGSTLPPDGAPNYMASSNQDWSGTDDVVHIFEFHVDWVTPANSTFALVQDLVVEPFDANMCYGSRSCIPQPGTSVGLDAISDRLLMHLWYRNFGDYGVLVTNQTVDVNGADHAGIRWYEIRDPGAGAYVYQQGTFAPDADHRWMGSIAMDGAGNMALGYSIASSTLYPSIRYTGREAGDPLGEMTFSEGFIITGTGSQTGTGSRWGDYSAMSVDPVDDCTFWYTQEYIETTGTASWQTRIASFQFPSCLAAKGKLIGNVTDTSDNPLADVKVMAQGDKTYVAYSGDDGNYAINGIISGTYDVVAQSYGYVTTSVPDVVITEGMTTTQDIQMAVAPRSTVDGVVTDATTGWPLYAQIDIEGYPFGPIWTNPETGAYSVSLVDGIAYTLTVSAWSDGYEDAVVGLGVLTTDTTVNVALNADLGMCAAPGYTAVAMPYSEDFEASNGGYVAEAGGEWEWGTPAVWPFGCHSGDSCWGTDLNGNYDDHDPPAGFNLTSPVINLAGSTSPGDYVTAKWWQALAIEEAIFDKAYAEVSINGGAWTTMWEHVGGTSQTDWAQKSFDISAAAGGTVQFRWRLFSDQGLNFEGYYIDDVEITVGCNAQAGGLVIGNVYNGTGDALTGATVSNDSGESTLAVATVDEAVDDAFYLLFSPAGVHAFTAGGVYGYGASTLNVTVVTNDVVTQDFMLASASAYVVEGTVTDATTGWPLYASVDIGSPEPMIVWTDPATGYYSATLYAAYPYAFTVNAWVPGYNTALRQVMISGNTTEDFALSADAMACSAPGYTIVDGVLETFETGDVPAGWTIVDNAGNGQVWTFPVQGNLTGGSGGYAIVDSDGYGSSGFQDTELRTPSVDFSGETSVMLEFDTDYYTYTGADFADVDVSVNGGMTWVNVWRRAGANYRGPAHEILDISALAAGEPDVMVRFYYYNASYEWWWQVDNVVLGDPICAPPTDGGLVVGNVYDENTGDPLVGAEVSNATGMVETMAVPDDDMVGDGFYTLFGPSGVQDVSATMKGGYGVQTASVTVVDGDVVVQDFDVPAGMLDVAPLGLEATLELGMMATTPLMLTNNGGWQTPFALQEKDRGFAELGPIEYPDLVAKPFKRNMLTGQGAGVATSPEAPPFAAGDVIQSWPTSLTLGWGVGYNLDASDLWVGDLAAGGGTDLAYRFLPNGTNTGDTFDLSWAGVFAADMTYNPNTGMLWVMDVGGDNCIHEVDPAVMAATGNTICPSWSTSQRGLAYDPTTDTYFAGGWNDAMIYHFASDGTMLASVNTGIGIAGLAYNPATQHVFAVDSTGATSRFYVLDAANAFALVGQFTATGFGTGGAGLEMDCDGNLWAVEQSQQRVYQIDSGEEASLCAAGLDWLSEAPESGTIAAGSDQSVLVTFDAAYVDQPGMYYGRLDVKEETPYIVPNVLVTMTVTPPASWGKVTGTVIGLGVCDADPAPLEEAEVLIESATGQTWMVTTDVSGTYQLWLDHAYSPLTVTVMAPDYYGETGGVVVVQGETTVVDFELRALLPCLSYDPADFDVTLPMGDNTTELLTLSNTGAGMADYELVEINGGFMPMQATLRSVPTGARSIELSLSGSPRTSQASVDPWAPTGSVNLALDDGSAEDSIGLTAGGQFVWLNRFTPDPGDFPFHLDQVSLIFNNSVAVGDDIQLVFWQDADGDPSNGADFVYAENVEVLVNDLATWNDYMLSSSPVFYGPGDVLVGVVNRSGSAGYVDYPAAIDQNGSQGRSWIGIYSADPPDPPTLPPDSDFGIIDSYGLAGNWTLRASGETGTGGGGGGAGIPWLTETPVSGTIAADTDAMVDLTFDAGVPETMQPGTYYGQLKVSNNAPSDVPNVPVTLTVTAPDTWGKISGVVTGLGYCDDTEDAMPLEEAEVTIESSTGLVAWVLLTDENGAYQLWLDAAHGPVEITVAYPDYITQVFENVVVTAGGTTVQDAALRWAQPCLSVDPDQFDVTVTLGMSTTVPLTLTNAGAGATDFGLAEENGGFMLSTPIHIARSNATYPVDMATLSIDAAPVANPPTAPVRTELPVGLFAPNGSMAYATEPNIGQFLSFDVDVPTVFNPISSFADAVWAGDFGADGVLYAIDSDMSQLITIDPATGTPTTVGPIAASGGQSWTGMALDPTSGTMYASSASCGSSSNLYSVDLGSGTATLIGAISNAPCAIALAVDNTGQMYTYDIVNDVLLSVDKATGAGTVIGSIGFDANYGQGMDFDEASGQMLMAAFNNGSFQGELRVVDLTTGATALVGVLGGSGGPYQLGWLGLPSISGGGGGGIPWLTEDPETGNVPADSTFVVDLTFDASDAVTQVTQPGEYFGTLFVNSDDPVNDEIPVPVTMTVLAPATWGKLMGTVTSLGYCDADPAPLAGADVLIESWMTETVILTSTVDLLVEGFEGTFPPTGWSLFQSETDDPGWQQSATVHSGSGSAWHNDDNLAVSSDSWLISPQVSVPASGAMLTFWERDVYSLNTYYEYHGVLVTTNANPDPSTATYTELYSGDVGTTWVENTLDLSAYAGQDIYIAFLYSGDWADEWYVDDVSVTGEVAGPAVQPISWLLTTDVSGTYKVWLDEMYSPVTITVSYPDHQKGEAMVAVTGQNTTTQDFDLRWLVPCVTVAPDAIIETVVLGMATTVPMTITNDGAVDSPWNLYTASMPTWLSAIPISGNVVADGGEAAIAVTLDSGVLAQPGEYTYMITSFSDDPVAPVVDTPVTFTVMPPAGWAVLDGTVYSMGHCDAEMNPLEDADVTIENGISALVTTDANGEYSYWLAPGTYTVTASAADHTAAMEVVTITTGVPQTQDFVLTWLGPCLTGIEPSSMEVTVAMGMSTTLPLTMTNAGAGALGFSFSEEDGGSVPLAPSAGPAILFMFDDIATAGEDAYRNALTAAGFSWTDWDLDILSFPTAGDLAMYDVLIWADESSLAPGDTQCQIVADWLVSGDKAFFATSYDFLWDLQNGTVGNGEHNLYLLLNTVYVGDYAGSAVYTLEGVAGDPIGGGLTLALAGSTASNGDYADETMGAPTGFLYGTGGTGSGYSALTHYKGPNYKTVWLGVNFHNGLTTQSERDQLMSRIMGFLAGADVPWLDENPGTGTVPAANTFAADIIFDASVPEVTQPGDYAANLIVETDDPVVAEVTVPVTMHVTLPATYGQITGTVMGLGPCDDPLTAMPLAEAEVTIESATQSWTLSTDNSGVYDLWLDEMYSPVTITVMADGYVTGVITDVQVVSSTTTMQDFDLRPEAPCMSVAPDSIHEVVTLGMSTTAPMTISNIGATDLNWLFSEADEGMLLLGPQSDQIVWLSRSTEGLIVSGADSGQTVAYPAAYRYVPARPSAYNVLVYTDDWQHSSPNTYPELALQELGLAATVHVDGDYAGFVTDLTTGGPWDLVVWSGENYNISSYPTLMPALLAYVEGGGALAATYWQQLSISTDPLWAAMDFEYVQNDLTAPSAYWWIPDHGVFTNPESAPEWITRFARSGTSQGTYIEPLAGGVAVAGYTVTPTPDQANIVIGNEGRTLYKGLRDISTDADADSDGVADGVELWENIMVGLLEGFGGDAPWLFEDPTSGTTLSDATSPVTITLDASVPEVTQPGDYFATLTLKSNDGINPEVAIPVTMTVEPPATWGKLEGLVQGLGYCNVMTTSLEGAVIFVESTVTTDTWAVETGADGMYGIWIDEMYSPFTVTVAYEAGYGEQVFADVEIVGGLVTVQDANLFWLQPCITVAPDALDFSVPMGTSTTVAVNLENLGAAVGMFLVDEWSLGFEMLGPLATGGPDSFGYQFADSNTAGISPIYDFVDISDVGTPVALGDNDSEEVAIGFDFKFYGNNAADPNFYDTVFVNSNGFLSFGAGSTDISPDPVLPDPTLPNNLIAAAWDNLKPGVDGMVYVQSFAQCPYHTWEETLDACFVAQYTNFVHADDSPAGTFEVILFHTGSILMQYAEVDAPDSTTGIENLLGVVGLNYGPALADELAICFAYPGEWLDCQSTQVPWLSVDPTEGDLASGASLSLDVVLDASVPEASEPGVYMAELLVYTNDSMNSLTIIPVTMTVDMPATMGKMWGTVYAWSQCDVVSSTMANAAISIESSDGQAWMMYSDADGEYGIWLPAGETVTMTVHAGGYVATTMVENVTAGVMPAHNVELRMDAPCVSVTPTSFDVTLQKDRTLTQTLMVHNAGAGDFAFNGIFGTSLWLSASPSMGVVPADGEQAITLIFDATGLVAGDVYTTVLEIAHADPAVGRLLVRPVRMTVLDAPVVLVDVVKTAVPADVVLPGGLITYTVVFTNTYDRPLDLLATDYIPANTTYVPLSVTGGATYEEPVPGSDVIAWEGTLGAGASATFSYVVEVGADVARGTLITNTVTIEVEDLVFTDDAVVMVGPVIYTIYLPLTLRNY